MSKRRNKARKAATPTPSADLISDGERHWYHGNTFTTGTYAGEVVSTESLMTSATCYACTKVLAETVAGLPGLVYKTAVDHKREKDYDSRAYELLSIAPNPEMDAFTFWEMAVTRTTNSGNFFAEIQRDGADRPVALWPIHPSRVEPMRDYKDGSLYWQVAYDFDGAPEYSDPSWRKEHLAYISSRNMLNIVGMNSNNGIIAPGMWPAANEVGMDFATRRYGSEFFSGGATPSGFVSHPGFIDDPNKRANFRNDLNQVHSNKGSGHKIGVLWQAATYTPVSISPEQAQFLETRKFTADQICKFYGVPPSIIGDYQHSKFATADAMMRAFVMTTLGNLCVRLEKAVNRQVLNVVSTSGQLSRAFTKPYIYQFALDGLMRGDPETRAKTWHMMRMAGVATGNEWREAEGMNPMDGEEGEWAIVQGGSVRLSQIDNQGTRQNGQATEAPSAQAVALAATALENTADALEQMAQKEGGPKAQVRGASLAGDTIVEAIIDIATDAVARVHQITTTQIERWRTQDPADVTSKLAGFWVKQQERLLEALGPADKLALRLGTTRVSGTITTDYLAQFSSCDNHSIFSRTNTLNIEDIVKTCVTY